MCLLEARMAPVFWAGGLPPVRDAGQCPGFVPFLSSCFHGYATVRLRKGDARINRGEDRDK